eukprot:266159_1
MSDDIFNWQYGPTNEDRVRVTISLGISFLSLLILVFSVLHLRWKGKKLDNNMVFLAILYETVFVIKYIFAAVVRRWYYWHQICFVMGHALLYIYWIQWAKSLRLIPKLTVKPASYIYYSFVVNMFINACTLYHELHTMMNLTYDNVLAMLCVSDIISCSGLMWLIWTTIHKLHKDKMVHRLATKASILCGASIAVYTCHFMGKVIYLTLIRFLNINSNELYLRTWNWMYHVVLIVNFGCIWLSFPFLSPKITKREDDQTDSIFVLSSTLQSQSLLETIRLKDC